MKFMGSSRECGAAAVYLFTPVLLSPGGKGVHIRHGIPEFAEFKAVAPQEVLGTLRLVRPTDSSGVDGIPMELLKQTGPPIAEHLAGQTA